MLMQDLKAQIAQASADRDAKAESKAKNLQAKADATGDLKDTTSTRFACYSSDHCLYFGFCAFIVLGTL
jgi:hypothetical protein